MISIFFPQVRPRTVSRIVSRSYILRRSSEHPAIDHPANRAILSCKLLEEYSGFREIDAEMFSDSTNY